MCLTRLNRVIYVLGREGLCTIQARVKPLLFLLLFFPSIFLGFHSSAADESTLKRGKVLIIPIREQIDKTLLYFLRRVFQSAENDSSIKAIVVDMDTPGGSLRETEEIISWLRKLRSQDIEIFTYVNIHAQSAGAIISMATDEIYMATGSRIGSATPILMDLSGGVQEMSDDVKEKILSDTRALVRGLAQENGYPPDLAMAFVDQNIEYKVGDRIVCAEGKVLNLTAKEAVEIIPPLETPLLAKRIVEDIPSLIELKNLSHLEVVNIEPHGAEQFARWITLFAPILMAVAFIGIYLEVKTPGFGIPGIIGGIALVLFLFGHYIAGLAGKEDALLILLGITLLLVEVFILPGFGIAGVLGIFALLCGMILAMIPHLPKLPDLPESPMQTPSLEPFLNQALLNFFLTIIISGVAIYLLAKILPKTPLYSKLVLQSEATIKDGYVGIDLSANSKLLGLAGVTLTPLHPSGIAMIGGQRIDVVSTGDYIDSEEKVEVVQVDGPRIVVEIVEG